LSGVVIMLLAIQSKVCIYYPSTIPLPRDDKY